MAIDLSGLKVGTAWRVRTSGGDGTLIVFNLRGAPGYVVLHDTESRSFSECGYTPFQPSGLSKGGQYRIEQILHELKPVADITASDLDGRVIETEDGGKVLFADGHAVLWDVDSAVFASWPLDEDPAWCLSVLGATKFQAAYAAELERRKNPPVEIVWLEVLRIGDKVVAAHCCVRDDVWRINWSGIAYSVFRGLVHVAGRGSVKSAEEHITAYYATKDRAAST